MASFATKNGVLCNFADTAPAPCKDYCQVLVTLDQVIYRCWKISIRTDQKVAPIEVKDSHEDFYYDDRLHSEIHRVFGKHMVEYLRSIASGQLDYLPRLDEKVLVRIIRFLDLEDVARLAQVSKQFRKLCTSDDLWIKIYQDHSETPVTDELSSLADAIGWRKLFFTNKLQLQVQLRRQAQQKTQSPDPGDSNNNLGDIWD